MGRSVARARESASALKKAGLTEINISTGKDHQEWLPVESVINSAEAVSNEGILTLITVEMDGEENECLLRITSDKRIKNLIRTKSIAVQSNSWMPFNNKASKEKQKIDKDSIKVGCDQIFGNCVITPHDNLSACCGLTLSTSLK